MINNLIRSALEATDNYIHIYKYALHSNVVSDATIQQFVHFYNIAHDSLEQLGELENHSDYMNEVKDEILEIYFQSKSIKAIEMMAFKNFDSDSEHNPFDDQDIEDMKNMLDWDDIYDLYTDDELIHESLGLDEKITVQNRIKRSLRMKRSKSKLKVARNMKLKRTSSIDTLKRRAVVAARRMMYKKLLMGRDKSTLSAQEKDRLEQRVKNLRFMQSAIAIKLLPKMRTIEQKRLAHKPKR